MIQLVAPWLSDKHLVRLHSKNDHSLYDSILTCLYCNYRYFDDIKKSVFLDQFVAELGQLEQGFDAFDTICYHFEVNIIIITASSLETKVVDKRNCIYKVDPTIVIEKKDNRYYPVGLHDRYCGTQVVFYSDDHNDSSFLTKLTNNKSCIENSEITFKQPLAEFNSKDMFKAYRI